MVIFDTVAHFLGVLTEKNEKQQNSGKIAKSLFREFFTEKETYLLAVARKISKLYMKKERFAISLHQVCLSEQE